MIPLVLALAGATAVVVAGHRRSSDVAGRLGLERRRSRRRPLVALGRFLRTSCGRPPRTAADARVGTAAVVAAAMLLVDPFLVGSTTGAALLFRRWRRVRRARTDTTTSLTDDLPDLIDLLVLLVSAGHTVPTALPVLVGWAPEATRRGLGTATLAIDRGVPVAEALTDLQQQWGDPGRPLVRALLDHVRNGTPISTTLQRLSDDARATRRRAAETRARRLPVLLLFPLVFCTLPAFGLLTVAPIVAGTLRSLDGERLETSVSSTYRTEPSPCTPPSSRPRSRSCPSSAMRSATTDAAVDSDAKPASPRPSTRSSCSAPPPSRSCSSPGPASRHGSASSSTPSSTR
ncbi:type II secretion system F family protein [Actinospongicola halichondriae]|uniref:type II secretion system F family protein n=1 Tax=Actinospongicola halichondriae TaxID=3236844 RepID=UPI003D492518